MGDDVTGGEGSRETPDIGKIPGPDSGLRTPPSSIERGLKEAADALRGVDGGEQGGGEQGKGKPGPG
jgi:hypothetical protein